MATLGYTPQVHDRLHMVTALLPYNQYTSECKSLWGEPERVHRIAVNIEDECTV